MMNYLNLTLQDIQKLNEPIVLDDSTLIGSVASNFEVGAGAIIMAPINEVVELKRVVEFGDHGERYDVIYLCLKTTEGEEIIQLSDFIVVAAHADHITY